MSLDKTKVLSGPFNLSLVDDANVEVYGVTGLKKDSVSFGIESKTWNDELEDDSEDMGIGGRKVTVEITHSELDPADLDSIEDSTISKALISFPGKNKTITVQSPDLIYASVDNLKTKITIVKTAPIGTALSSVFSIT
jgi:hypothetical protein